MRSLARDAAATHLIAARLALVSQDYATAVAELRPLVIEMPNLASARFLLGAALLAQGNLEQAEGHLSRLVQLAPTTSRDASSSQRPGCDCSATTRQWKC